MKLNGLILILENAIMAKQNMDFITYLSKFLI